MESVLAIEMPKKKLIDPAWGWDVEAFSKELDAWLQAHPEAQLADFAHHARISVGQIHRLKRAGVDPGTSLALRVAAALGRPITALVKQPPIRSYRASGRRSGSSASA